MSRLRLSLACWDYDRTRPLMDGTVQPEGIDLIYVPVRMPESFFRMRHFREFDVCEMSLSSYVRSLDNKPRPYVAIPVFPSRVFRHGSIFVNRRSGVRAPADLSGKRVGVPEYQMSAAVWIRGILAEHHSLPVDAVSYHTGGLVQPGRVEPSLNLPASISVEPIPPDKTLSEMLDAGELDALYTAEPPSTFGRTDSPVVRLFGDYQAAEESYFRHTGIFPIMYTVVIKRETYEANPWIAQSLFKAFCEAQRLAYAELREMGALKTMLPWLSAHVEHTYEVFATTDYWPYGLVANASTLEVFLRYVYEQHIVPYRAQPAELFAPETLKHAKS